MTYTNRLDKIHAGFKFMSTVGVDRLKSDRVKTFWVELQKLVDDEISGKPWEPEVTPEMVQELFKA